MWKLQVAEIVSGSIKIKALDVAIVVAIIGLVSGLVSKGIDWAMGTSDTSVENARLALEQRKATAELYRTAMSIPEATKCKQLLVLLLDAKLIEDFGHIRHLEPTAIPEWPANGSTITATQH